MSQWTHICGNLKLSASVFNIKTNKNGTEIVSFEDPEEQFVLGPAYVETGYEKSKVISKLIYDAYEYSLPRVKPIIEKIVNETMPKGETGLTYFLNQRKGYHDSSSSFLYYACEKNAFKKRIEELYTNNEEAFGHNFSFEHLKEIFHLKLGWVHQCQDFTFSVADDVRGCSGEEMLTSLENLIKKLGEAEIFIEDCCIIFTDEYNNDFHYLLTSECSELSLRCDLVSNKDNSVLAYKRYIPTEREDMKQVFITQESADWKTYIK